MSKSADHPTSPNRQDDDASAVETRPRVETPLGWLAMLLAGITMLGWSWGMWADPIIDFGRELYVPWRLVEGQRLYADIAYFNGPFSPTLNALWFRIGGVGIQTLVFFNAAILALTVALLYRLLSEIADRRSAAAACTVFLLVFCFGQLGPVANFNYICPYSHEMTHGFALALLALNALSMHLRNRGRTALACCGGALGLAFLTKPEIFLAALLAVAAGTTADLWRRQDASLRDALLSFGLLLASAALPVVAAFAALAVQMPAATALEGTLGGWAHVFNREVTSLVYYQSILGLESPARNLAKIARWSLLYAVCLGLIPLLLARFARSKVAAVLIATLPPLAWILAFRVFDLNLYDMLLPLPIAITLLAIVGGLWLLRGEQRAPITLATIVLAAVFLAKIALHTGVAHYGFVLAAPAAMVVIVALLSWLPRRLDERGEPGSAYRIAIVICIALGVAAHLRMFDAEFDRKIAQLGTGADAIRVDARGRISQDFLDDLDTRIGPDASVLVLPEGVMLNYLARRVNPTRFIVFLPPEVAMFGETAMLQELESHPPDYVALVQRSTQEYGLPIFGIHYGTAIRRWLDAHYEMEWLLGSRPLQPERLVDHRWGILLLEHKDRRAARKATQRRGEAS